MNNDIKEILDDKKVIIDQHWNYIIIGNEKYYELPKRLLDYITNLQEENKRLEENPLRGMFANITDDELLIDMGYTNKENEELKQRINKAIEYIKDNCILSDEWTDLDFCNFVPTGNIKYKQLSSKKVKDLLSILRGEDNESRI